MSRNKQEALLLEERIEKIRKRNEEITRRHLEVEADKQNAAKLNALVQITSPAEDWPIGGRPPHSDGISRGRRSEQDRSQQSNSNSSTANCHTFGERNGPPPDAAYKFLADTQRDSDRRYSQQQPHWRGKTSGRSRGAFTRGKGRQRSHQYAGGSDVSQPEYEAWRAERNRIDSDRINRQKTAEGHWRREWDNEKITQEEEDVRPAARMSRGSGFHRGDAHGVSYHDYKTRTTQNCVKSGENASPRPSRVSERGAGVHGMSRGNRSNVQSCRQIQSETHPSHDGKERITVVAHGERNVVSVGESIKISVPNDCPSSPVGRIRVNAPVVAGTGRVGPRQRPRFSYSSQSEDEAPLRRVEVQPDRTSSSNDKAPSDSWNTHSSASALSKPPLPPSTGMKPNLKPKKQHFKKLEQDSKFRKQRGKKEIDSTESSKCVDNKEGEIAVVAVENYQKGTESGGDDSWEDVTTTSGNDSACEELLPCSNTDSTTEFKSQMLHNEEVKSEVSQNTEVALGNTEFKSDLLQNKDAKSGILQNTEAKVGLLPADQNNLNSESEDCTEVSPIIPSSRVPDAELQEAGGETVVSEGSTECNEHEDVSEIYFEKSYSDMLVETKEGSVNERKELEEKENMPHIITCEEKILEGETKTESENRCGQDEELWKVKAVQTTGNETLSDGAAENCMNKEN